MKLPCENCICLAACKTVKCFTITDLDCELIMRCSIYRDYCKSATGEDYINHRPKLIKLFSIEKFRNKI